MYIEDGVPQRIYISDRTHSIPLRLPNMCLTQPLPALSVEYIEHLLLCGLLNAAHFSWQWFDSL